MISDLINQWVEAKKERADLAAQDKILIKKQAQLEADIMKLMSEAGTFRAASDAGHTVNMRKQSMPTVTDWATFYDYVSQTKEFDLLQKRLAITAFRDRWNAGTAIPGVESADVWDLSIHTQRT